MKQAFIGLVATLLGALGGYMLGYFTVITGSPPADAGFFHGIGSLLMVIGIGCSVIVTGYYVYLDRRNK